MLELLFYFLVIGPFLMSEDEKKKLGIIVLVIGAILWIGSLFYK